MRQVKSRLDVPAHSNQRTMGHRTGGLAAISIVPSAFSMVQLVGPTLDDGDWNDDRHHAYLRGRTRHLLLDGTRDARPRLCPLVGVGGNEALARARLDLELGTGRPRIVGSVQLVVLGWRAFISPFENRALACLPVHRSRYCLHCTSARMAIRAPNPIVVSLRHGVARGKKGGSCLD